MFAWADGDYGPGPDFQRTQIRNLRKSAFRRNLFVVECEKARHFLDKAGPGGLVFQNEMVFAV